MPALELPTSKPNVSTTRAHGASMHAIVQRKYGPPEVLAFEEVVRPVVGENDALVRVSAANVSIGDHHLVAGLPYLIRFTPFGGVPHPRNRIPGMAMAGVVEAIGSKVTTCQVGDEVYGEAPSGAFAEYVAVPANLIAAKPHNLSFAEAAAAPWAVTALQALRDAGGLQPRQKVLINGASGGVGTWAVQLAKALGAEVTAVCSTRNVELVRALGADTVIDYTQEDFVTQGARFDLMLDAVGNRSVFECKSVLRPDGVFVSCSGGTSGMRWLGRIAWMVTVARFTSQKLKPFVVVPRREDLLVLTQFIEAGKAKPVIERQFPLSQIGDALRHIGAGHARGQVVLQVA